MNDCRSAYLLWGSYSTNLKPHPLRGIIMIDGAGAIESVRQGIVRGAA